jgi:hypothetical protein
MKISKKIYFHYDSLSRNTDTNRVNLLVTAFFGEMKMSPIEQILNFLSSLPPEFVIPIAALAVVGYALYILHDVIRGKPKG